MNKIVIYYEGAENIAWDRVTGGFFEVYASSYKIGFEQMGYEVFMCNIASPSDRREALRLFQNGDVFFSCGVAGAGLELYLDNGESLYERYDVPHVVLLADHPYIDPPYSKNNPGSFMVHIRNCRCRQLLVAHEGKWDSECMSMEDMHSELQLCFRYKPGQPMLMGEEVLSNPRDIDILEAGALHALSSARLWHEDRWTIEKWKIRILDEVADYLETHIGTTYDGFMHVLSSYHIEQYMKQFYPLFFPIYNYIHRFRRLHSVKCLVDAGLQVDVCDESWETAPFAKKIHRIHKTKLGETQNLYLRTKVLINTLSEWEIHGRVLHAVARGAAVASEYSDSLDALFGEGNGMEFIDWSCMDEYPGKVASLVEDEAKRKNMAAAALDAVASKMSTYAPAKSIVDTVLLYMAGRMSVA